MSLFINRIKKEAKENEKLVKSAITTQLSEIVKEIQLGNTGGDISGDSFNVNNPVLCNVVESLFLHGLKNSLISQARRVFADVDERPEPSFWALLLLISHKQIINQIGKLSQITTETGQCRAWIRIALNDSLLSSYFFAIQQNISAMKTYYNLYAYVRDSELLDVAQKLIEGLESSVTFNFPTNSSLLNTWPPESLILAGTWSPTLRTCPVASGVDIAQSMPATQSINSETCSIDSLVSSVSSGFGCMLNEDEALKRILNKHSNIENKTTTEEQNSVPVLLQKDSSKEVKSSDTVTSDLNATLGNSLNKRLGWSFSKEEEEQKDISGDAKEEPVQTPDATIRPKSMESSYNALIQSYNTSSGANGKIPNLSDVISNNGSVNDKSPESIKEQPSEKQSPVDDFKLLILKVGTIAQESGLDNQNFECKDCKLYLGITQKWKVCGFSGYYYCENCMSEKGEMVIPARIVHNWDFKKYSVSKQAEEYVNEIMEMPTINIKTLNPSIYSAVNDMAKLQKLRVQLNYLRDYLFTCHEPIIEELKSKIGSREYMYEHIHQYAISDLLEITNGVLAQRIQEVVDFGKHHVLSCWLCSQKGFICEVCHDSKVLYPFNIESVYRCTICNSIFHKNCLNKTTPCPKCARRRKRTDLDLSKVEVD